MKKKSKKQPQMELACSILREAMVDDYKFYYENDPLRNLVESVKDLRKDLETAEEGVEDKEHWTEIMKEEVREYKEDYEAAKEREERIEKRYGDLSLLIDRLAGFAKHSMDCPSRRKPNSQKCLCGLKELLESIEEEIDS